MQIIVRVGEPWDKDKDKIEEVSEMSQFLDIDDIKKNVKTILKVLKRRLLVSVFWTWKNVKDNILKVTNLNKAQSLYNVDYSYSI